MPSNKEGKNSKCFADRRLQVPLLKSRLQLNRSYTEFASLPHRPTVLAVICLVYLRLTRPNDARSLSCQQPPNAVCGLRSSIAPAALPSAPTDQRAKRAPHSPAATPEEAA